MKKILFLMLLSGLAYAQDNNQNAGINTTTPTETLDIDGTLRVREINTKTATVLDKTVAADANGVLKVRPTTPNNQAGIVYQGEPFNTGVDASLFAPVMITFIPHNAAAGYKFTLNDNNQWILNIDNKGNYTTGQVYAKCEILWINRQ